MSSSQHSGSGSITRLRKSLAGEGKFKKLLARVKKNKNHRGLAQFLKEHQVEIIRINSATTVAYIYKQLYYGLLLVQHYAEIVPLPVGRNAAMSADMDTLAALYDVYDYLLPKSKSPMYKNASNWTLPLDESTYGAAISGGRWDVVLWLKDKKIPANSNVHRKALKTGDAKLISRVEAAGFPLYSEEKMLQFYADCVAKHGTAEDILAEIEKMVSQSVPRETVTQYAIAQIARLNKALAASYETYQTKNNNEACYLRVTINKLTKRAFGRSVEIMFDDDAMEALAMFDDDDDEDDEDTDNKKMSPEVTDYLAKKKAFDTCVNKKSVLANYEPPPNIVLESRDLLVNQSAVDKARASLPETTAELLDDFLDFAGLSDTEDDRLFRAWCEAVNTIGKKTANGTKIAVDQKNYLFEVDGGTPLQSMITAQYLMQMAVNLHLEEEFKDSITGQFSVDKVFEWLHTCITAYMASVDNFRAARQYTTEGSKDDIMVKVAELMKDIRAQSLTLKTSGPFYMHQKIATSFHDQLIPWMEKMRQENKLSSVHKVQDLMLLAAQQTECEYTTDSGGRSVTYKLNQTKILQALHLHCRFPLSTELVNTLASVGNGPALCWVFVLTGSKYTSLDNLVTLSVEHGHASLVDFFFSKINMDLKPETPALLVKRAIATKRVDVLNALIRNAMPLVTHAPAPAPARKKNPTPKKDDSSAHAVVVQYDILLEAVQLLTDSKTEKMAKQNMAEYRFLLTHCCKEIASALMPNAPAVTDHIKERLKQASNKLRLACLMQQSRRIQ